MANMMGISENHERMMLRVESYINSKLLKEGDSVHPFDVFEFFQRDDRFSVRDIMEALDHLGLLPEEVQRNYRESFPERIWND